MYVSKKSNCPAKITLRAKDKQSLEITDYVKEHCHDEEIDNEMSESPSTMENGKKEDVKDQPQIVVKKRHRPSGRPTGWTGPISPALQEADDDSMQIDDPDYVPVSDGMDFETSTEAASPRKKRTFIQKPKVVDDWKSEESGNSSIEIASDEEEPVETSDAKNKKKSSDEPAIPRKPNKTASRTPEESYSLIKKQNPTTNQSDVDNVEFEKFPKLLDGNSDEGNEDAETLEFEKDINPSTTDDAVIVPDKNDTAADSTDELNDSRENQGSQADETPEQNSLSEPETTSVHKKMTSEEEKQNMSEKKKKRGRPPKQSVIASNFRAKVKGSQDHETSKRKSLNEPGTSLQKKVISEEHQNIREPEKKNKRGRPAKTGVLESKSQDKAKPRKFVERSADARVKLILSWLLKTDRLIDIETKKKSYQRRP